MFWAVSICRVAPEAIATAPADVLFLPQSPLRTNFPASTCKPIELLFNSWPDVAVKVVVPVPFLIKLLAEAYLEIPPATEVFALFEPNSTFLLAPTSLQSVISPARPPRIMFPLPLVLLKPLPTFVFVGDK